MPTRNNKTAKNNNNNRSNQTKKVKKPSQANIYKAAMASKVKPLTAKEKMNAREKAKQNAKNAEEARKAHAKKAYKKRGTLEATHPHNEYKRNPTGFGPVYNVSP